MTGIKHHINCVENCYIDIHQSQLKRVAGIYNMMTYHLYDTKSTLDIRYYTENNIFISEYSINIIQ